MNDNKLQTTFLNTKFSSPFVVASGSLTEKPQEVIKFINAGAGAVVPRTTRLHMLRKKHPSPHLFQKGQNMINSEWTGEDLNFWLPYMDEFNALYPKIIMSISGRNISDCVEVCKQLDKYKFPVFEINVSCAASSGVHGQITKNIEFVKNLCLSIKDTGIKTPFSLKLGHSDALIEICGTAKEAGANAITAINTFGPVFDFSIDNNGTPKRIVGIQGAKGGLSGTSLFHITLTDVAEISRQIGIPVMASGGVTTVEDAVKMIMAGASLVQLYTVLHLAGNDADKKLSDFNSNLLTYMNRKRISSISEIKGKALSLLFQETNLDISIPEHNHTLCTHCNKCMKICLRQAISKKENNLFIDKNKCIGCGHCISVCPINALS